jgi:hypothetical protein
MAVTESGLSPSLKEPGEPDHARPGPFARTVDLNLVPASDAPPSPGPLAERTHAAIRGLDDGG